MIPADEQHRVCALVLGIQRTQLAHTFQISASGRGGDVRDCDRAMDAQRSWHIPIAATVANIAEGCAARYQGQPQPDLVVASPARFMLSGGGVPDAFGVHVLADYCTVMFVIVTSAPH